MPQRPPFLCQCGRIVQRGDTCPCRAKAARARKERFDQTRPNARARGYTKDWEREAKAFLALPANRLCGCGAPATVVMHIQSIRARPDLRMLRANWRPGCQRCNAKDAALERKTSSRISDANSARLDAARERKPFERKPQ